MPSSSGHRRLGGLRRLRHAVPHHGLAAKDAGTRLRAGGHRLLRLPVLLRLGKKLARTTGLRFGTVEGQAQAGRPHRLRHTRPARHDRRRYASVPVRNVHIHSRLRLRPRRGSRTENPRLQNRPIFPKPCKGPAMGPQTARRQGVAAGKNNRKTSNNQHRTPNIEVSRNLTLEVRSSMLVVRCFLRFHPIFCFGPCSPNMVGFRHL